LYFMRRPQWCIEWARASLRGARRCSLRFCRNFFLVAISIVIALDVAVQVALRHEVLDPSSELSDAPAEPKRPVAISVSINYVDMLSFAAQNSRFFSRWYVVTVASDAATREWCQRDAPPVVACLFESHEEDLFIKRRKKTVLDKGRLIAMAQKRAHAELPGRYYLVMDSDIILPDSFGAVMRSMPSPDNTSDVVYYMPRLEYTSRWRWKLDFPRDVQEKSAFGYFQLYTRPICYLAMRDCPACFREETECDLEFRDRFQHVYRLPHESVCCHIGPRDVNWGGRTSESVASWGSGLGAGSACTLSWRAWLVYYYQRWRRQGF